ncbi:hypothetical protein [Marimonas lutisalis]|uniref:hypothetical protein n=1 Tax=Marimonas lutisalis TaxID=2545756 RepID=UPI001960BE1E|nr:hypothetical protein [Marimonas lutisalis]
MFADEKWQGIFGQHGLGSIYWPGRYLDRRVIWIKFSQAATIAIFSSHFDVSPQPKRWALISEQL